MKKKFKSLAFAGAAAVLLVLAACDPGPGGTMAEALKLLDKGEPTSAIIKLKSLLSSHPNQAEGRYLLGKALLVAGDALGAEAELRRAEELKFDPDKVAPLLAEVLVALQRHQVVVGSMAGLEPKDPAAYSQLKTQLAIAYMALGRLTEAQAALDESLKRTPGLLLTLDVMARLKSATGEEAAAKLIVEDLVKRHPSDPSVWTLKGDILAGAGEEGKNESAEAYRKAIGLQPKYVQAHAGLIIAALNAGQVDAARSQWQQMKTVQPNHAQTRFFEALLALREGDVDRARELSQGLIKMSPDNARLQTLAGYVEMQGGNFVQAETHLVKALLLATEARPPREALTELYLRMGQFGKALDTLAPLMTGKDEDAALLNLAGRANLLAGKGSAAEAAFQKAAKMAPADTRHRTGLALAQLDKGQRDAALKALDSIASTDPATQADLPLINARLQRKEYPAALAAIDRLAAKLPKESYPEFLRAQVAAAMGNRPLVRKSLEAALQRDPNYVAALGTMAELDIDEGKGAAATTALRAAVKRAPRNVGLQWALADFVGRTGGAKAEVVSLMQQAILLSPLDARLRTDLIDYALKMADNKLALSTAQSAAAALPDNDLILDRLGLAQQASGEIRQALATFGKLNARQPSAPGPLVRMANAHLSLRNADAAWQSAKRAMELVPGDPAILTFTAEMAVRTGRPQAALEIARAVQKQAHTNAAGWYLEGEIELARGRPDAAISALRKAMLKVPDTKTAKALYRALLSAKKDAEAERHADAWLKSHPADMEFLLHLGLIAQQQNNTTVAEQRYRQMLARQPNNLEALNNLAQLLAEQKKPGAVALASKANQLAPNRPPLMDTLAVSLASEGQINQSLELQVQVVSLSPDQPEFMLTLAKLLIQAGKKKPAIEALTRLAKYGPEFAKQDEVSKLLKDLGG